MNLEVKFQAYAEFKEEYESAYLVELGPVCDTPDEAIEHARLELPKIYEDYADGFVPLRRVVIEPRIEGFPRRDLPWEGWIGAG